MKESLIYKTVRMIRDLVHVKVVKVMEDFYTDLPSLKSPPAI